VNIAKGWGAQLSIPTLPGTQGTIGRQVSALSPGRLGTLSSMVTIRSSGRLYLSGLNQGVMYRLGLWVGENVRSELQVFLQLESDLKVGLYQRYLCWRDVRIIYSLLGL